ncbi:unnamed protein product [Amoebophrya sp. A25]|nr:unnamed protein product [Amoebophrya sp. A25]|eukprot:GSA25T00010992001.1
MIMPATKNPYCAFGEHDRTRSSTFCSSSSTDEDTRDVEVFKLSDFYGTETAAALSMNSSPLQRERPGDETTITSDGPTATLSLAPGARTIASAPPAPAFASTSPGTTSRTNASCKPAPTLTLSTAPDDNNSGISTIRLISSTTSCEDHIIDPRTSSSRRAEESRSHPTLCAVRSDGSNAQRREPPRQDQHDDTSTSTKTTSTTARFIELTTSTIATTQLQEQRTSTTSEERGSTEFAEQHHNRMNSAQEQSTTPIVSAPAAGIAQPKPTFDSVEGDVGLAQKITEDSRTRVSPEGGAGTKKSVTPQLSELRQLPRSTDRRPSQSPYSQVSESSLIYSSFNPPAGGTKEGTSLGSLSCSRGGNSQKGMQAASASSNSPEASASGKRLCPGSSKSNNTAHAVAVLQSKQEETNEEGDANINSCKNLLHGVSEASQSNVGEEAPAHDPGSHSDVLVMIQVKSEDGDGSVPVFDTAPDHTANQVNEVNGNEGQINEAGPQPHPHPVNDKNGQVERHRADVYPSLSVPTTPNDGYVAGTTPPLKERPDEIKEAGSVAPNIKEQECAEDIGIAISPLMPVTLEILPEVDELGCSACTAATDACSASGEQSSSVSIDFSLEQGQQREAVPGKSPGPSIESPIIPACGSVLEEKETAPSSVRNLTISSEEGKGTGGGGTSRPSFPKTNEARSPVSGTPAFPRVVLTYQQEPAFSAADVAESVAGSSVPHAESVFGTPLTVPVDPSRAQVGMSSNLVEMTTMLVGTPMSAMSACESPAMVSVLSPMSTPALGGFVSAAQTPIGHRGGRPEDYYYNYHGSDSQHLHFPGGPGCGGSSSSGGYGHYHGHHGHGGPHGHGHGGPGHMHRPAPGGGGHAHYSNHVAAGGGGAGPTSSSTSTSAAYQQGIQAGWKASGSRKGGKTAGQRLFGTSASESMWSMMLGMVSEHEPSVFGGTHGGSGPMVDLLHGGDASVESMFHQSGGPFGYGGTKGFSGGGGPLGSDGPHKGKAGSTSSSTMSLLQHQQQHYGGASGYHTHASHGASAPAHSYGPGAAGGMPQHPGGGKSSSAGGKNALAALHGANAKASKSSPPVIVAGHKGKSGNQGSAPAVLSPEAVAAAQHGAATSGATASAAAPAHPSSTGALSQQAVGVGANAFFDTARAQVEPKFGDRFYAVLEDRMRAYEVRYGVRWDLTSIQDKQLQEKTFLHLLSFVVNCWSRDEKQCYNAEILWKMVLNVNAMRAFYHVKPFTKFFSMIVAAYEKFVCRSEFGMRREDFHIIDAMFRQICPEGCGLLNAHLDSAYVRLLMIFGDSLSPERESGYDTAFHLIIKRRKEYKPHSYNAQYMFLLYQAALDYVKEREYLEEFSEHINKWADSDGMNKHLNREKTTKYHIFGTGGQGGSAAGQSNSSSSASSNTSGGGGASSGEKMIGGENSSTSGGGRGNKTNSAATTSGGTKTSPPGPEAKKAAMGGADQHARAKDYSTFENLQKFIPADRTRASTSVASTSAPTRSNSAEIATTHYTTSTSITSAPISSSCINTSSLNGGGLSNGKGGASSGPSAAASSQQQHPSGLDQNMLEPTLSTSSVVTSASSSKRDGLGGSCGSFPGDPQLHTTDGTDWQAGVQATRSSSTGSGRTLSGAGGDRKNHDHAGQHYNPPSSTATGGRHPHHQQPQLHHGQLHEGSVQHKNRSGGGPGCGSHQERESTGSGSNVLFSPPVAVSKPFALGGKRGSSPLYNTDTTGTTPPPGLQLNSGGRRGNTTTSTGQLENANSKNFDYESDIFASPAGGETEPGSDHIGIGGGGGGVGHGLQHDYEVFLNHAGAHHGLPGAGPSGSHLPYHDDGGEAAYRMMQQLHQHMMASWGSGTNQGSASASSNTTLTSANTSHGAYGGTTGGLKGKSGAAAPSSTFGVAGKGGALNCKGAQSGYPASHSQHLHTSGTASAAAAYNKTGGKYNGGSNAAALSGKCHKGSYISAETAYQMAGRYSGSDAAFVESLFGSYTNGGSKGGAGGAANYPGFYNPTTGSPLLNLNKGPEYLYGFLKGRQKGSAFWEGFGLGASMAV